MNEEDNEYSKQMGIKAYLVSIGRVTAISYRVSPLAIIYKVINGILDSVVPLLTAYLAGQTITKITEAFGGKPGAERSAFILITLTVLVAMISRIIKTASSYADEVLRYKVVAKVSDALYQKYFSLPFWMYEDKEISDMYERANEFSRFFGYVFDRVIGLLTAVFSLVAALVGFAFVAPWFSLIVSLAMIPNIFIQYRMSRADIYFWRKNSSARRKYYFTENYMTNPKIVPELRLYGLSEKLVNLRESFRHISEGERLAHRKKFIKYQLLGDIIENLTQYGVMIWTVIKIASSQLAVGQFVYMQQLTSRVISSSQQFIGEVNSADEDLAKLKDYTDFMSLEVPKEVGASIGQDFESIEFKNVSFAYPTSDKPVLRDINMKIERGNHIAIVGENGAGKTTLVKLILGFYKPTSGQILLNGVDMSTIDNAQWHKMVAVLLQNFVEFSILSVKDNITFGQVDASPTKARIDRALESSEFDKVAKDLPDGIDTTLAPWLEKKGATDLSGGQWQRLALARNFYRQSQVVILDEPTSAIDALAESRIFDHLYDSNRKRTIIAISHRLTTIENADMIYVFQDGEIVQSGSHSDLAKQKGQYATMFRRQLRKEEAS